MSKLSEQDRDEICLLYEQGTSIQVIADNYEVACWAISRILDRRGITRRPSLIQSCNVNTNYSCFEEICTEEQSYWLGFLYADGCILSTRNSIALKLKDKEHVEKFREFIGGKQKIHKCIQRWDGFAHLSSLYQYSIGSQQIVRDLAHWGCMPRKTNLIRMPDFLTDNLVRHFIRGFVDGDGTIHCTTARNEWRLSVCGNKSFLLGLQRYLVKACSLSYTALVQTKHSPDVYNLRYSGNLQVPRVVDWLYRDAIVYLDCKYEIAMHCLRITDFAA